MVKLLTNAPGEIVPSPQVGHSPPTASCCCHMGPAAMLLRLNVYSTPFLLATARSGFPPLSVVSVGVLPQSESKVWTWNGSCQLLLMASVVASSATIACARFCVYWLTVPVLTTTVLLAASSAGEVHTPPPTWPPLGTKTAVLVTACVVKFTCIS